MDLRSKHKFGLKREREKETNDDKRQNCILHTHTHTHVKSITTNRHAKKTLKVHLIISKTLTPW